MHAILCFGDSITFGRGENPSRGWVGRLKADFESEDYYNCVYNLGIPGDTSTDLLKRFRTEVSQRVRYQREDDRFVICIAIGINDSPEAPVDVFRQNMTKLVRASQEFTEEVFLIGCTCVDEGRTDPYEDTYFSNEKIRQFNSIIQQIAREYEVRFIDVFDILEDKTLIDDGIHPNSEGYEKLFHRIKGFLQTRH